MKYDRPVSELLDECARTLPAPFTRQDILRWFAQSYPDVRPSTVESQIVELTQSDAPGVEHYSPAGRRPVLERVGHGLYRRARGLPRQPALFGGPSHELTAPHGEGALPTADVLLIGSVKSMQTEAAPARLLYTSTLFARRRRYAEASGRPWFVLSSRWGLVAPDEVIAPYDVVLGDMPATYRHGWAEFVAGQLAAFAPLAGTVVEIHAGDHDVDALRPAVERAGAALTDPVVAHSMGETLAWYDTHQPDPGDVSVPTATVAPWIRTSR